MKAPFQFRCAGLLLAGLVFCFLVPGAGCAPPREITEIAFSEHARRVTAGRGTDALVSTIEFPAQEARAVRLVIRRPHSGKPCLDEIEIYGPDSSTNVALASRGAMARASSLLPGYAIHAVAHLNDGLYGNVHSWIAATTGEEWVEIELPSPAPIKRVVLSRDRNGQFKDRQILEAEVRLSVDGKSWQTEGVLKRSANQLPRSGPQLTFPSPPLARLPMLLPMPLPPLARLPRTPPPLPVRPRRTPAGAAADAAGEAVGDAAAAAGDAAAAAGEAAQDAGQAVQEATK